MQQAVAQTADTTTKQVVKVEYGPNDTVFVKAMVINGELIGGCDITLELFESGDLAAMVADAQKAA